MDRNKKMHKWLRRTAISCTPQIWENKEVPIPCSMPLFLKCLIPWAGGVQRTVTRSCFFQITVLTGVPRIWHMRNNHMEICLFLRVPSRWPKTSLKIARRKEREAGESISKCWAACWWLFEKVSWKSAQEEKSPFLQTCLCGGPGGDSDEWEQMSPTLLKEHSSKP